MIIMIWAHNLATYLTNKIFNDIHGFHGGANRDLVYDTVFAVIYTITNVQKEHNLYLQRRRCRRQVPLNLITTYKTNT